MISARGGGAMNRSPTAASSGAWVAQRGDRGTRPTPRHPSGWRWGGGRGLWEEQVAGVVARDWVLVG